MKISEALDQIDAGFIALPVFQRGYVWNRNQVRQLFVRLYRAHPVGSLLFWGTQVGSTAVKGDLPPAVDPVKMLLDGQQRITSLYGVMRGSPPDFFDGDAKSFTGLHFNLADESFEFYQASKMANDPLWVDVTEVMQGGFAVVGPLLEKIAPSSPEYMGRLAKLLAITQRDLPDETISGEEFTVDVVVDIFNDINSGGTKLSKGDLALARICADRPETRDELKGHLTRWAQAGFDGLDMDWLLRSVNTVLTGEAQFSHLQGRTPEDVRDALKRAASALDYALNLVADRLGLDHGRVLFGRQAFPVMAYFIDQRSKNLTPNERGRLLYWYALGAMRGLFSGSIETVMNEQLAVLNGTEDGLERLIDQLHLAVGGDMVLPDHFDSATSNSRFYPVLYMLTRMESARNFCDDIVLTKALLGKGSSLEVHHIFPKAQLYRYGYDKRQVNALANFCFLTAACNKEISKQKPEDYFSKYEGKFPGVLRSQWIPDSDEPWTLDRYPEFLEQRRQLLADAANSALSALRFGSSESEALPSGPAGAVTVDDDDGPELSEADDWAASHGMSRGILGFELGDIADTTLDLAWPDGLQHGKSEKVALLLNEPAEVLAAASAVGFRCFQSVAEFKHYVESEILLDDESAA